MQTYLGAITSANKIMFLPLCVCSQHNSKKCERILMNFLEWWDVRIATTDYILVLIQITMQIKKLMEYFLPLREDYKFC